MARAEGPARRHRFLLAVLQRLPQAALSRLVGRLADLPVPRLLRRPLYGFLARRLGVDLAEAAEPLAEYRSVNAFFVRPLRVGCRSWPSTPQAAGSPVDGVVGPYGTVREGQLLQAKGVSYRLEELLECPEAAEALEGGHYLTLYLAPRHYHRIHAPLTGSIREARHVPGRLLPVTPWARGGIARLFPRNERLVACLEGDGPRMAVVAVGAFNVGRISAAFDPSWNDPRRGAVTNLRRRRERAVRRYDPPREVVRGEEIMTFNLGSTVVLVWERQGPPPSANLEPGGEVRLGQPILGER